MYMKYVSKCVLQSKAGIIRWHCYTYTSRLFLNTCEQMASLGKTGYGAVMLGNVPAKAVAVREGATGKTDLPRF